MLFAELLQQLKEGKHSEEVGVNVTMKVIDVKVNLQMSLELFQNQNHK